MREDNFEEDNFGEELYEEYLYFEYKDKCELLEKEIEKLLNIIEESIKLANKVDDMESARDLYDLIMDIKNKLYESDKRGD